VDIRRARVGDGGTCARVGDGGTCAPDTLTRPKKNAAREPRFEPALVSATTDVLVRSATPSPHYYEYLPSSEYTAAIMSLYRATN